MFYTIKFRTDAQHSWKNLNEDINAVLAENSIGDGICCVFNPHSTAGLFINSYMDPKTPDDIFDTIKSLVPMRVDFRHQFDTPSDAAAHIKSCLVGNSETVFVEEGRLKLGGSQGIIFAEFDGPRDREVWLKVIKA
ncbi:secondary thiamine-phosphate synthase enzyme YjbQ [Breznakiella homolactica]|uniref:YjbQ family protein n=1 Tax=Breznakiella homolactica TaxID=2798577 RepID=A0A7T7XRH2_9SPIR|nr:secondary thiamine-phosphate synthase enzyme YjbQ [Breznakiella homolactica]QQO11159.1 secondary thiamine-phosphate synthase enzyme YjbQ [Breznakiella homolactica]